jgi:hypothetical protein
MRFISNPDEDSGEKAAFCTIAPFTPAYIHQKEAME